MAIRSGTWFPCFADPYLYEIIPTVAYGALIISIVRYAILVRLILILIAIPAHLTIFEFVCVYNPTAQLIELFPFPDIYA